MRKEPITVRGQQVSPRDVLVTLLSSAPREEAPLEMHRSAAILGVNGLMDAKPTTHLRQSCSRWLIPVW
jgi:hypothetical protein